MSDNVGNSPAQAGEMTFWDHLDTLRGVLLKAIAVFAVVAAALFAFMPEIFNGVILAPCTPGFPTYRALEWLSAKWPGAIEGPVGDFSVELVNYQLASQFFIHMSMTCWLALVLSFPVVIYLFWTFIKPGLYPRERRGASAAFMFGVVMFYLGVCTGYFLVFPLTVRFLADYQLSDLVPNVISLDSYTDTFITIVFLMGVVFELPLLAWLLGRMGLLTRRFFSLYRRHAIVALMVLAAVITPTGDPFTLFAVFIPIYLLWEFSATLVPKQAPEED